jgi:pyruvyltransferase
MKTIKTFWISTPDGRFTNVGDILTNYLLHPFGINAIYEQNNPQLYGVGSILHTIDRNTTSLIWSSGMMYNTHELKTKYDPIALRGKLTAKQFLNDTTNTALGDGGLILERIYKPRNKESKKYKLGVFPNYVDIVNMRDNPIEDFNIFNNPDTILIDPRNYIETVVNQCCSCENIISSSLHGAVISDSYGINNSIFGSRETDIAIHRMQGSFKFRDYYSIFDIDFKSPALYLDNNTTFEEAISACKTFNKPNIENAKEQLVKSIDKIKSYI